MYQTKYLSDKAVANRYEVSRATVWRWANDKQLPKPIKINGSTRWIESDLIAFELEKTGREL